MALESPNTLQSILDRLLSIFGGVVGNSIRLNESVAALQSIERMKSVENLAELSLDDGSYRNLFHLLAVCLNEARVLRSNHLAEAFNILANASRDREWDNGY